MQSPAQEWQDAFRRARNGMLSWALIGAMAAVVGTVGGFDYDSRADAAVMFIVFTTFMTVTYGVWRLGRLLVVRHDLQQLGQPLTRVYLALVDSPIHRNLHELVLVWMTDPRTRGGNRLRRPDLCFLADLSEDDRTDDFSEPVVREAWTPVRPSGRLRRGRWFYTVDNLVLTVRRGGPFAWLASRRGFDDFGDLVPAEQPDLSGFAGVDRPVGFRGFTVALLWRLLGAAALGVLGVLAA